MLTGNNNVTSISAILATKVYFLLRYNYSPTHTHTPVSVSGFFVHNYVQENDISVSWNRTNPYVTVLTVTTHSDNNCTKKISKTTRKHSKCDIP